MAIPLFILVFGSVYVGYLFKDMMIGMGTDFWRNALLHSPQNIIILESEFLPAYIKLIPVIFSIIGAGLALILNYYYSEKVTSFVISPIGYFLYKYLNKKYFFDMFYNRFVVRLLFYFGYHVSFKTLDRGLIEKIGPNGLVNVVSKITKQVSSLQTGFIYHYLFIFVMGLLLITLSIMFSMHLYIDLRLFLIFILTIIFVYTFKLD
jgi:NADH-ubiquinone oxidoreductase chain 5